MSLLPSSQTPLNRHSLQSLELWLTELGANRSTRDPCLWSWITAEWRAEIKFEQDELIVTWNKEEQSSSCSFSYGLSRSDVENAMKEGL